ncbi:MAG: hypothetical protein ACRD0M_03165 [Acidimicrobiales bacterium]
MDETRIPTSPFATLDAAFRLLADGPGALTLDGAEVGAGLPARPIPFDELKSRLLHPSTPYHTRDAALNVLLTRARTDRGAWMVAPAGVLLPGLRRAVAPLVRACPGKAADIEAEALTGMLVAVRDAAPGQPRPAARLTWAARRAAEQLVRAEQAERGRPAPLPVSVEPPRPFGHPDLVLARAVSEGVVCADDAELIGATRLEEMSLAEAAQAWGVSYSAIKWRRARAEQALVHFLGRDFVTEAGSNPGSKGVGRPRQGRRPDRRPELRQTPSTTTTPRR